MRQQVSKDLYEYWRELKGARAAPNRADIDPAAIREILADTFIIEVDSACAFPMRLCGTRLEALWLGELKGRSFVDLWRRDDRRDIARALLTVVDGVTPIVAGVAARAPDGERLELELLLLPLRHFGKTHSRVLGALSPQRQPDWLGRRSVGALELVSIRMVAPAPRSAAIYVFPSPAPARIGGGRPPLVVYQGDKGP